MLKLKTISNYENFYTICNYDLEQQSANDVIRKNPTKKGGRAKQGQISG